MDHAEAYLALGVTYGTDLKKCESEARALSLAFHPDKASEIFTPKYRRVREAIEFLRENPKPPRAAGPSTRKRARDDDYEPAFTEQDESAAANDVYSRMNAEPPARTVRECAVPASYLYAGGNFLFAYSRTDITTGKHQKTQKRIRLVFPPRKITRYFSFTNGGDISIKNQMNPTPIEAELCIHVNITPSCGWALIDGELFKTVWIGPHEWGKTKIVVEMPDGTTAAVNGPKIPGVVNYINETNFVMKMHFKEKSIMDI